MARKSARAVRAPRELEGAETLAAEYARIPVAGDSLNAAGALASSGGWRGRGKKGEMCLGSSANDLFAFVAFDK